MDPADPDDRGSRHDGTPEGAQPAGEGPGEASPSARPPGRKNQRSETALPGRTRLTGRKKVVAWSGGVLTVLVLIGVLGTYFVYQHLNANLRQVEISGELGRQPVDLHPQA